MWLSGYLAMSPRGYVWLWTPINVPVPLDFDFRRRASGGAHVACLVPPLWHFGRPSSGPGEFGSTIVETGNFGIQSQALKS